MAFVQRFMLTIIFVVRLNRFIHIMLLGFLRIRQYRFWLLHRFRRYQHTFIFLENLHLSCPEKIVTTQHHYSSLLVTNTSNFPLYIPQYFCFEYLLSGHVQQQSFFDQISALCRHYNGKRNRQVTSHIFTHPQLPRQPCHNSRNAYQPSPSKITSDLNSTPLSPPLHLQRTLELLAGHLLNIQQSSQLCSLLLQFSHLFNNSRHNISNTVIDNVFNTILYSPPAFHPHRNPHNQKETQRLIDGFLKASITQESNSPYAALDFTVPHKENRLGQLVVDYRALNIITISDASPLPYGEDLLQELRTIYKYFSKLDLESGYHQLRIPLANRPKTAFVVSHGHYEFLVLPMEAKNVPVSFQKIMSKNMKSCHDFCLLFLNDIIAYSKTFDEYINHLRLAFDILAKAKLVLNASKFELAFEKVFVLGHMVSQTTITPTNEAIQAILDLSESRTLNHRSKYSFR